jgi:hypothetical protein
MKKLTLGTLAVFLLAAGGHGADNGSPPLTAEFAKQRDLVLPSPTEQSYRKIAWRTSVLRFIREERP